ncbi:MAG: heavy metal-responsive transcriptional regulator [Desulfobulbaceae bacterium]|nr:heavy metal-responsive transcriptional regulator [Desulfobulbaceae bacterium]
MKISKVAGQAGITVETVRFYEKKGLLPPPARNESGYRVYSPESLQQLLFITRSKNLGFSLKEIKELLHLRAAPDTTCTEIKEQAEKKFIEVEKKIQDLERIKAGLREITNACPGAGPLRSCPIIGAIIDNND